MSDLQAFDFAHIITWPGTKLGIPSFGVFKAKESAEEQAAEGEKWRASMMTVPTPNPAPPSKLLRDYTTKKSIRPNEVTKEERARIDAIDDLFDAIDKNGDAKVSKRELKTALKAGGPAMAAKLGVKRVKDIEEFMAEADKDEDGSVDRMEFLYKIAFQLHAENKLEDKPALNMGL